MCPTNQIKTQMILNLGHMRGLESSKLTETIQDTVRIIGCNKNEKPQGCQDYERDDVGVIPHERK